MACFTNMILAVLKSKKVLNYLISKARFFPNFVFDLSKLTRLNDLMHLIITVSFHLSTCAPFQTQFGEVQKK